MVVIPAAARSGSCPSTPLVKLDIGELRVNARQSVDVVGGGRGFVLVQQDRVIVLAGSAELASEIDEEKAIAPRPCVNQSGHDQESARGQEKLYPSVSRWLSKPP